MDETKQIIQEIRETNRLLRQLLAKQDYSPGDWLTVQQAAEILEKHPNTIRRMIYSGRLVARKLNAGKDQDHYRISRQSIENFLQKGGSIGKTGK